MDYDFDTVQDELTEGARLWQRSPRVGPRGYKSSWPDYVHDVSDFWGKKAADMPEDAPRPLPLTREEVQYRDDVSAWLMLIPDETNRRVVALAVHYKARAHGGQIPWGRVLRAMGQARGKGGLQKRYTRAIARICEALNRGVR